MKKLIAALCLFISLLILTSSASAHSGGTDSDGGHYQGDDYHYHHGYPAHDHYDIDGDGDLDCPYDFKDDTDRDPDESGSGHSYHPSTNATESSERPRTFWDIIGVILGSILLAIPISLLVFWILGSIICVIFGEDRGWPISLIIWLIVYLAILIWAISNGLK